ncbi:MAG TPA: cation-translocating P-type ATPase [Caldilineaceae bacterium]|nr:cation-translocating P-type ATPase [Caldilineaceae bacterium]
MADKIQNLNLRVQNLDCEHDANVIERGLTGLSGLATVRVYPRSAKVAFKYNPDATSPAALEAKLASLGFPAQQGLEMTGPPKPWRNPKVLTSLMSGLLLLVGWLLGVAGLAESLSLALYIPAILIGGYYFGREAIEELIFERVIGIELLMSIAAVVAALMGQVAEGAMLVFLYSISEAAEGYTEERTRSAIKALMDLAPKTVLVRRNGREEEIPVETIQAGDLFIVRPGQAMATDGQVQVGRSSVNQAPVTGESVPVEKQPGDPVYAGSINGEGALEVQATKAFADNTISRIIQMVEEAQERKGQSQRFIERFGARYSPVVLLIGILLALLPPLFFSGEWTDWITRATVFIVAAAPCALVISIPITMVATLGAGARQGVLIKGGLYIEELARVKVVAMDKTGTLTRGEPEVTDVMPLHESASRAEVLALAAGIEQHSEHPLARAIVHRATAESITPVAISDFQSLTGAGVSAQSNGKAVYVGSPDFFQRQLGAVQGDVQTTITRLQSEGKTVILVGDAMAPVGLIAIRDNIRPTAPQTIQDLHAIGIEKVVMLTGDNERTAHAIARELGIDEIYADLKPEDKMTWVRTLVERYGHVVMVGDGVNDAPALAEATVGIAMGAAGTDVALETADVALMADDLAKLPYAITLAKRNQRVVNQNLVLSTLVISVLVIGAIGGFFTLPVAVVGHEISEFIVIGSGLRMLRG